MQWAKEEKLKTIAAKTIMDPEYLDDHMRESGWARYSMPSNMSEEEEKQRVEDVNSKGVKLKQSMSKLKKVDVSSLGIDVQQVMDDLLKQSSVRVEEQTRSIPSEDAFIPCINLVLAYFTKVSCMKHSSILHRESVRKIFFTFISRTSSLCTAIGPFTVTYLSCNTGSVA